MRLIPIIAAGLMAAASVATPAEAQRYRHGGWHGGGGWHHGGGWRGGYGYHRSYGWHGGYGWHHRHSRLACHWRYHHRACYRVWF